jgi:polyisoprenoid-binding protein YceI
LQFRLSREAFFTLKNTLGLFGIGILLSSSVALADAWKIDGNHTAAQFAVRHMGISTVRGAFTKVSGSVDYDAADVSKSAIDVSIDAASVDTRVEMRDKDLKSAKYFDVEKYPTITFKSTKVESAGTGKLKATGDLTIHGVTKQVVLAVEGIGEPMKDPRGNMHLGATASTTIDRTQFGVGEAAAMIGSDITITIDVEMTKPAAK